MLLSMYVVFLNLFIYVKSNIFQITDLNIPKDAIVLKFTVRTITKCILTCDLSEQCKHAGYETTAQNTIMCYHLKSFNADEKTYDGGTELKLFDETVNIESKRSIYCLDGTFCGNCKCVYSIDGKVPYVCDCRDVQATAKSCESAVSSQDVSGIYTITTTQTSFNVICEIAEGKTWTTYMNLKNSISSYFNLFDAYESFYGNLTGSFWIGLKSLYALTNVTDMVLRFEFDTESNKKIILEYTGFRILDDTNYGMFYKHYRVIQAEYNVEDHMKCIINQPFAACENTKSAWWGECKYDSPVSKDGIKWNFNETIVEMKMNLRKTAFNKNSVANCHTMLHYYQCPSDRNYFINPDNEGSAFKVYCRNQNGNEVRTFFLIRHSSNSTANLNITQAQMYNGLYFENLYIANYTYYWIGFRNLYRLTQSFNAEHMLIDDPGGYDIFYQFMITNQSNFAMTYNIHGRHNYKAKLCYK